MDFTELHRKTQIQIESSTNISFGGSYKFDIDPGNYDYVSNFVLQIELPALTTAAETKEYYTWVDSIGHAIIDYITLKIGTKEIYSSTVPYGLWLDIFNELNDATRKEWGLIGKNSSVNGLKVTNVKPRIIQIPLHLPIGGKPYSLKVEDMLPLYLLDDNNKIQIDFKLRNFNELILYPENETSNTPPEGITSLKLIYDSYKYKDLILRNNKKTQYKLKPFIKYYTILRHEVKVCVDQQALTFDAFKNKTISGLFFVFQNTKRIQSSNPHINEPNIEDSTYGNDWFNYTGDKPRTDNTYGLTDPIDKVTEIKLDRTSNELDNELEALYFRNVLPIMYYLNKPSKHIYVYPMKKSKFGTKGLFTFTDSPLTMNFQYNLNDVESFKIQLFGSVIKKLSIIENNVSFEDIKLEEEKLLDTNLALVDTTGSLIQDQEDEKNKLQRIKEELKSEILLQITTGTITGEIDYSLGEKNLEEEDTEKRVQIKFDLPEESGTVYQKEVRFNTFRFPSPSVKSYYLNILLTKLDLDSMNQMVEGFNTTNSLRTFYLIFNKEKYDEKALLNQFQTKNDDIIESIIILETQVENSKYKFFKNARTTSKEITTTSKDNINNIEQYIQNLTTMLGDIKDINTSLKSGEEKEKKKLTTELRLLNKVKEFNSNKTILDNLIENQNSDDLFNYRYRYKKFLSIKDNYFRVKSTTTKKITDEDNTNIKNKLKQYLLDIYNDTDDEFKNLKFVYISNIIFNLFSTPFNELIANSKRFEDDLDKFINQYYSRLKLLKIKFEASDKEIIKAIDFSSKDKIENSIKFTDGVKINYNLNPESKTILMLSEIKYNLFDIKQNIIQQLNQDYNTENNTVLKTQILNNIISIDETNNILSNIEIENIEFNKSYDFRYTLKFVNTDNQLPFDTFERQTIKDINANINNISNQPFTFQSIIYKDNYYKDIDKYKTDTNVEGTIIVTLSRT